MGRLNYEILRRKDINEQIEKLSVLFLDLDDFKEIYDNLGHLVGDAILKEFSLRLRYSIRKQDIAARFGGDEFIVLLLSIEDEYDAINTAGRILDNISKPYIIDGHELHVSASIGIANFPRDAVDSTTLIRNADIAMYRSKQAMDAKTTMYHPSLDREIQESFSLKARLRNALINDELFLVYQPMVDIERMEILGVEALVRWRNGGDVMLPSNFINTAEKIGMIYQIGEWCSTPVANKTKPGRIMGIPIYLFQLTYL